MFVKFGFTAIWVFFFIRLISFIDLYNNIYKFDFKNWIKFFQDGLSIFILIGLSIYLLIKKINDKSHISTILIIYPVCGLIGYFLNGTKNAHQDFLLQHQFITLCSLFLFFTAVQNDKIFDYKFKERLLKISLIFIFVFFLLNIFPNLVIKFFDNVNLRVSNKIIISIFNSQFEINQNINGASRIMLILLVALLILFKKYILKKKLLANLFFSFSVILVTAIYLLQSRLSIFASFLFTFFLIFYIKNISLKKKFIYFLIIIITPIFIYSFKNENDNRFTNNYETPFYEGGTVNCSDLVEFCDNIEKLGNDDAYFKEILLLLKKGKLSHDNFLFINNYIIKKKEKATIEERILLDELIENNLFYRKFQNSRFQNCTPDLKFLDNLLSGRVCGWQLLLKDIKVKDLLFGKGFFADQVFLKGIEKISSNSWLNILYNAGVISLFLFLFFLTIFFVKFFKIKNVNHKNFYVSISHYLVIYFIFRSLFEDTLAFVSIDFLFTCICLLVIKANIEKKILK